MLRILFFYNMNHREILARAKKNSHLVYFTSYLNDSMSLEASRCSFVSFQAMAFTSLSVVIISTMTFILGTFPEFQSEEESGHDPEYPEAVVAMHIIDNITVGFFLIEYVVSIEFLLLLLLHYLSPPSH